MTTKSSSNKQKEQRAHDRLVSKMCSEMAGVTVAANLVDRDHKARAEERVTEQLHQAEADLRRANEAVWHADQLLTLIRATKNAYTFTDPTRFQAEALTRLLMADVQDAERLRESAWRIYCEELGIDPKAEAEEQESPDPVRDGWVGKDGRP